MTLKLSKRFTYLDASEEQYDAKIMSNVNWTYFECLQKYILLLFTVTANI